VLVIRRKLRDRLTDERGITLVLMCLLMVVMLGMAGLVVNIGLVRADRMRNKSAADVAAQAGMLAADVGGGQLAPFKAACAARNYLQTNHAELASFSLERWTDGNGTDLGLSNPCAAPPTAACNTTSASAARASFAWFHGEASGLVVDIKAGYDASDLTSGGFSDESYHTDTGKASQFGCDQLAVIVREQESAGFGKVLGANVLSSTIRTVARANFGNQGQAVIALLLLEQSDCNVLTVNGTNARVLVKGYGAKPGLIHADSIGNGANCNSQILNGVVSSPSGAPSGPSIWAKQAETGTPPAGAQVSVSALYPGYAGADPTKAATACPSTVFAEPSGCVTGSARKGRLPVDVLYYDNGVALRSLAGTRTSWTATQAQNNGFTVIGCSATGTIPQQKVFVDCTQGFGSAAEFTADDAEIVFNGTVSVNNTLAFDNPRSIFVKGPSNNGSAVSVGGNGVLSINAGAPSPAQTCASRFTPTLRNRTTKFVMVNGSFSVNGNNSSVTRMCGTTVLMGSGPDANGSPTASSPGRGAVPYNNAYNGAVGVGGNGSLDWTAPNASDSPMYADDTTSAPFLANFEDLALWTETANNNSLSGGGSTAIQGIFFLPNANPFTISGGASQSIDRDAQFITRKLTMSGNGVLSMRPNPNNAISFSFVSGASLVR